MKSGNGTQRNSRGRRVAKVTLREVADAAGVSTMTVSNVIHDRIPVSPALRERVQEKVRELGYIPHRAAQELAGVARPHFGLLYTRVINPFIASVIVGSMSAASRLKVDVTVQLAQLDDAKALRDTMHRMENAGVEGFLLPSPIAEFAARTFKDKPLRVPAVGITAAIPFPGMASVRVDENQATLELMSMLFEAGHTRIGHIAGPERQSGCIVRYESYREALASKGIKPRQKWVVQSTFNFHEGEKAALTLLKREPRVTAVFAANDTLAAAVLAAAHQLNITVPDDLSVVGYDDSPVAEQVWPALTTVRQDAAAMTERAVEVLHDRVQALRAGAPPSPADDVIFPYRIVRRSSIAPAPHNAG